MRYLSIQDPMETLQVGHDTSFALLIELQKRGWDCFFCDQRDLTLSGDQVWARVRRVRVINRKHDFFKVVGNERVLLSSMNAIGMRKDPPPDEAYRRTCQLLDLVPPEKTYVFNPPKTLLSFNEKLWTLHFPKWTPETVVSSNMTDLRAFLKSLGKRSAIAKPVDQFGGEGIFLIRPGDPNTAVTLETLTQSGRQQIVLQEYVKAVEKLGDKRVIWVDGRALGAMTRIPRGGDHRANMVRGGTAHRTKITRTEQQLIDDITPALVNHGVILAGLDIIGGRLTEINFTSPTGLLEVERLARVECVTVLTDAIESRAT